MDNYFVPFKGIFNQYLINVLDIDSGVEFIADDIFNLVDCVNSISGYCNLHESQYTIRLILMDGLLCDKKTLNWLGLQQIFYNTDYKNQKEFARWTRKCLLPALTLEKLNDFDTKTVDGINVLP